jgi:tRNA-modifying protein YgfZ
MNDVCPRVPLESFGVLRVRGADVAAFLQGQLSNDVALLSATRSLLAGYHNPQGRVIALLRLIEYAPAEVLAVLPRELAAAVAARLAKFVLRAKVQLADESQRWRVTGVIGAQSADAKRPLALPAAVHEVARLGAGLAVRVAEEPPRWLLLEPREPDAAAAAAAAPQPWQRLAVAAGEPQVYGATSEQFVAQMLNLDALGAIAFDKGCYTGQEVIARAHYRGRVKRRLQRFISATAQLRPGDSGELRDGRSFRVVDSVAAADGRCEFLAVTTLAPAQAADEARPGPGSASALDAEQLPLPYTLPE